MFRMDVFARIAPLGGLGSSEPRGEASLPRLSHPMSRVVLRCGRQNEPRGAERPSRRKIGRLIGQAPIAWAPGVPAISREAPSSGNSSVFVFILFSILISRYRGIPIGLKRSAARRRSQLHSLQAAV